MGSTVPQLLRPTNMLLFLSPEYSHTHCHTLPTAHSDTSYHYYYYLLLHRALEASSRRRCNKMFSYCYTYLLWLYCSGYVVCAPRRNGIMEFIRMVGSSWQHTKQDLRIWQPINRNEETHSGRRHRPKVNFLVFLGSVTAENDECCHVFGLKQK